MEKIFTSVFLFGLLLSLTACPFKETYKAVSDEGVTNQGFKIRPEILFYKSWHKQSSCDVGLSVENQTDSLQRVVFLNGSLTNSTRTLLLERIYRFGKSLPPNYTFEIEPKEKLLVGLSFQDSTKNFGDTIRLGFNLPNNCRYTFVYIKAHR